MDNMVFISIESRKGGVGKTTVSLALAQCLLLRGYGVLLIDLDVAGTRLNEEFISKSEFINELRIDNRPLNLVQLYKNNFLAGETIPSFESLDAQKCKCNLISSDIYNAEDGKPIEDPRIFFDPLHAFWMRSFVLKLAELFEDFLAQGDDQKKGVIILDNAPGFSSMETMVHEMLTTMGADKGKFLLVSSIDDQDLNAVEKSSLLIQTILEDKVRGGLYYQALHNKGDQPYVESQYFDEVWKELCLTDGQEPEYYSQIESSPSPSHYIWTLVNKSPGWEKEAKGLFKGGGVDYSIIPYIHGLQYYFSTRFSSAKPEALNMYYKNHQLSGDIKKIFEDDQVFKECVEISTREGHGFLQEDWRPMSVFRRISDYFIQEDYSVRLYESALKMAMTSRMVQESSSIDLGGNLVREYIKCLCETKELDLIIDEAVQLIKKGEKQSPLLLYTEKKHLLYLTEPIALAGKAIYYIDNYSSICGILNELIQSKMDVGSFMDRDLEKISLLVDSVIDGEKRFSDDFWKEWEETLRYEFNNQRMMTVLNSVLDKWDI